MKNLGRFATRAGLNRRAFLRGAGSVAIGLPFLESLPQRSAWAAGKTPVFTLFVVAQNGVVNKSFFPSATGALSSASLESSNVATSVLAPHAEHLLFLKGINYPNPGARSCGHAEGCVQTLTGLAPGSTGNTAHAAGPSADTLIAKALGGDDPLALYAGTKGFIAERTSFKAAGAGQVRAADQNPYLLYSRVVGLTGSGGTAPGGTGAVDPLARELVNRRKSVNDLVRTELKDLMGQSVLSADDRLRLDQHFQAIRDIEVTMGDKAGSVGPACSQEGLPLDEYEAMATGFAFKSVLMEEYVKLHLQILAVAFACNYSRVATLQWGDGTDSTKYDVASNASLGWTFHQLSHRIQSDSAKGNNPIAEQAHHEIDAVRMKSLRVGLDAFKAHGLQNNAQVAWTNSIADGPTHSMEGVPMIVWGSGGGFLKQGAYVDAGGTENRKVLNALMAAATRDVTQDAPAIGSGMFEGMKA